MFGSHVKTLMGYEFLIKSSFPSPPSTLYSDVLLVHWFKSFTPSGHVETMFSKFPRETHAPQRFVSVVSIPKELASTPLQMVMVISSLFPLQPFLGSTWSSDFVYFSRKNAKKSEVGETHILSISTFYLSLKSRSTHKWLLYIPPHQRVWKGVQNPTFMYLQRSKPRHCHEKE